MPKSVKCYERHVLASLDDSEKQRPVNVGRHLSVDPRPHESTPELFTNSGTIACVSHAVDPDDLASTAVPYGNTPFLLYSSEGGSARVNHVLATVESNPAVVRITGFGRGVAKRLGESSNKPSLSLLWPAVDGQEFSLIADGEGTVDGDVISIAVSAAVLHRPAPVDGSTSC